MKKIFNIIMRWGPVLLALAAVVAVLWWCGGRGGTHVEIGFDNRIELTSQEIRRIEDIGEWEFLSIRSEVVVDTLREGFLSDDRLVAVYTGTLRLGIDLHEAGEGWAQADADTVHVQLPAVRLLDNRFIDEARTRFFHESGTWSNQARKEMYGRARGKMLALGVTTDNLRQAEENARRQFTAMFRALGFHTVNVEFAKR